MNPKQRQLANKYIDLFYRRKVFIVVLFLLSFPVGLGAYLAVPGVCQAAGLLSYQRQTISSGKMTRDVTERIRDIVSTITQIVTSRTNLEKLIISLDLYPEARKHIPMEDKIQYYYEMAELRITNVSRLISLQEQSQGKQESIQDLERTLVLIADQINNRRKLLEDENFRIELSGITKKGKVSERVLSVPQQIKRHYEYHIAQDLEARSKLNLERRQKGSQFKIEDSARFPEKPIKPNFMMIMGMAVVMGLGVGFGGTLLLDFFDTTFRGPDSLESELGADLIATIPYIETSDEKKRRKRRYILAVGILILASGAIVYLFAVVWSRGYIVI